MSMYEVIIGRRTIRRFKQQPIAVELLEQLINAARLAPSAANMQPLEYVVVNEEKQCELVFEALGWAGYIQPKWTPAVEERPTAYVVILLRDAKNPYYQRDVGLATGNIILAAEAQGLGSCILCNIDKQTIREVLQVPASLLVDSVIALGYKAEHPVVEEQSDTVQYWRDEKGLLHVPKRPLDELLHWNGVMKRAEKKTKR